MCTLGQRIAYFVFDIWGMSLGYFCMQTWQPLALRCWLPNKQNCNSLPYGCHSWNSTACTWPMKVKSCICYSQLTLKLKVCVLSTDSDYMLVEQGVSLNWYVLGSGEQTCLWGNIVLGGDVLRLSLMKNISQLIYRMRTCRAVLKAICLIDLLRVCCFLTGGFTERVYMCTAVSNTLKE